MQGENLVLSGEEGGESTCASCQSLRDILLPGPDAHLGLIEYVTACLQLETPSGNELTKCETAAVNDNTVDFH